MKTSLYSPIFINPQAYYVFPYLYDVEPDTKSFIEQAVFAGTLIVQSSDDSAELNNILNGEEWTIENNTNN